MLNFNVFQKKKINFKILKIILAKNFRKMNFFSFIGQIKMKMYRSAYVDLKLYICLP